MVQANFVCKWADDSQRLILQNFDIICNSPSKIYHDALPFSPPKSWLHEYYTPQLLHVAWVVGGFQDGWGKCSRTVPLNHYSRTLALAKDLIAVGLDTGDITIIDAITGIDIFVLAGHTDYVNSVAFSLDGTALVSGSNDQTTKLWDIQTGGVVKTFCSNTGWVFCVSISPDQTTIASGSVRTICLWNVQTGDCNCILHGHTNDINFVSFFPSNSQLLISASSDNTVRQWNVNGHQVRSVYEGEGVAFSPDGTLLVLWRGRFATIQKSNSGRVIAKLQVPGNVLQYCCFSPDGKFVTGATGYIIYIWEITSSGPNLIETLVGHTDDITSLTFSSSLISLSKDKSIKFWQIGASTDLESTLPTLASLVSVSLQANDGIALSSTSSGMVTVWDISTGLCKTSFSTPVDFFSTPTDPFSIPIDSFSTTDLFPTPEDSSIFMWLINSKLVVVWASHNEWHIWCTGKEYTKRMNILATPQHTKLRISGDGSKVFVLNAMCIWAWSIQTEKVVCQMELEQGTELTLGSIIVDGSKVWVSCGDSQTQGWDFDVPDPTPISLSDVPPIRPCTHLQFITSTTMLSWKSSLSGIEDKATGRVVFWLPRKYPKPTAIHWDGNHLIAGYKSGEVLIMDFSHISLEAVWAGRW